MSFESLGLAPLLLSNLNKAGFKAPTSVQSAAIPQALLGKDLIVSAQTGSGKTAAFMLPTLHRMVMHHEAQKAEGKKHGKKKATVKMLVLTPTRELALQVADAAKVYGAGIKDLHIATVVGGMPYGAQIKALSRPVDILVATPGRLIDHLNAHRVNLGHIETLVLDEADRMLDMGFIDDMRTIVAQTPSTRQTLFFSATFEGNVAQLAQDMLKEPERINISNQKQKHTNIEQSLLFADNAGHKFKLLQHILENEPVYQAIVFTATKRSADDLADKLCDHDYKAAALHGDMNQRQRTRTLNQLHKGKLHILVATDVAARGIDIQGISHAINFDLPQQPEDYVHRIGRTGRAGRDGRAYSFATFSDKFKIKQIEKFTGQPLAIEVIEGLEPVRQASKPSKAKSTKAKGHHDKAKRDHKKSDVSHSKSDQGKVGKKHHHESASKKPHHESTVRKNVVYQTPTLPKAAEFDGDGKFFEYEYSKKSFKPKDSKPKEAKKAVEPKTHKKTRHTAETVHSDEPLQVKPSRKLRNNKALINQINKAVNARTSPATRTKKK